LPDAIDRIQSERQSSERCAVDKRGPCHTGKRSYPREQLIEELRCSLGGVSRPRQRQVQLAEMFGLEPRIDRSDANEASRDESRGCDEYECRRQLRDDEETS